MRGSNMPYLRKLGFGNRFSMNLEAFRRRGGALAMADTPHAVAADKRRASVEGSKGVTLPRWFLLPWKYSVFACKMRFVKPQGIFMTALTEVRFWLALHAVGASFVTFLPL